MRGAWWCHVAIMGPVTWPGRVVEMVSEESFGRKFERSATNLTNLMLRFPSVCENHDNADKGNLTALSWRSQQTRWYYNKSTGNESLTNIAFTLSVLVPRCPALRNDHPVTQTSQVYIDTAMESKASSHKHANQMILIRYDMFIKMLFQLMSVSTIDPIKPPDKIVLVTCVYAQC